MAKTRIEDTGWRHYKRSARQLAAIPLDVGVFDSDELTMIATVNEFGSDDGVIPERPVHRETFKRLQPQLKQKYAAAAALVTQGKASPRQAVARIGAWYAGKLRYAMERFTDPENAESTVKQKGFNDPLVSESRRYINAITFRIGDA